MVAYVSQIVVFRSLFTHKRRKDGKNAESDSQFPSKRLGSMESRIDQPNEARENAHIKTLYYGHELENHNSAHIMMDVPSVDTLQNFMQQPENQKVIQEADHIQETTKMVICSD